MRTTIRILVKTFRFELIAIALACLALAGGEVLVHGQLEAAALPVECQFSQTFGPFGQQGVATPAPPADPAVEAACELRVTAYNEVDQHATELLGFGTVLPVLAGILLGVAVVGRELESGTASLAWTLSRSRRRWYLTRAVLLALILGGILFVPGLAANFLEHARQPLVDPGSSFADGGERGPVFALRGLLTYALAVVAGAVLGRQLPAVIVTIALTLAVFIGFETGVVRWERSLAVWQPSDNNGSVADLMFDQEFRDRTSGAIVDQNDVMNIAPQSTQGGPDFDWITAHYEYVSLVVPGSRYGFVVAGETAALGGATILLLGFGLLVVNRRRPD